MGVPSDRAAYEVWKLEFDLTNRLLTRCERAERALLREINCPTDPVAIYDILKGEQPAPWPKRTAARDRRRALQAMHVLTLIRQVRRCIQFGSENSRLAAHDALLAGLYANAAAAETVLRQHARRGGLRRGQQRHRESVADDEKIRGLVAQWHASEILQTEYRTPATYVRKKLRLSRQAVYRRLRRLKLLAS